MNLEGEEVLFEVRENTKGTEMITIRHFAAAARTLLTGSGKAPELGIFAGPLLRVDQFVDFARHAQAANRDLIYLAFSDDVAAGPVGIQLVFPRWDSVHVRLDGVFWTPKNDGIGAIVERNGNRGFVRFDHDKLAQSPARIAKDLGVWSRNQARPDTPYRAHPQRGSRRGRSRL